MKEHTASFIWFAWILGVISAVELVPLVRLITNTLSSRSHDALLAWVWIMPSAVLFFLTFSCFGWEYLLLAQQRVNSGKISNSSTAIFCVGLVAGLISSLLWFMLNF